MGHRKVLWEQALDEELICVIIGRDLVLRAALVVGCPSWTSDEQGTPVQVRDGPAAVTVDVGGSPFLGPLSR